MNTINWICPHCFYENSDLLQSELSLPVILYCQKCNYSTADLKGTEQYEAFKKEQQYIIHVLNRRVEPSDDFIFRWNNFHYKIKEV